jgi:hypothetical protein
VLLELICNNCCCCCCCMQGHLYKDTLMNQDYSGVHPLVNLVTLVAVCVCSIMRIHALRGAHTLCSRCAAADRLPVICLI